MKEFSSQTRIDNIQTLQKTHFDIVIIGGGITGAGVARDAALRGLKVALVEASDFASGTSSRSSKLIHGGIRYLENMDFKLVFEALSERSKLFKMTPHLVHPLRFMIPLFKDSRVGMLKMGLGMFLYDLLALFRVPEMHERLSSVESSQRIPVLKSENLVGSYVYSDAYMDDDRLVHETMRSAHAAGAICVNYVKALSSDISDGKIKAIEVQDVHTRHQFKITAKQVVCTVGPWTDLVGPKMVSDYQKILRPTKGVHLTLSRDRLPLSSAVVMGAQESDRIVFAIPRHEMVIIGTTDTDFSGDPTDVKTDHNDVNYLLEVTNHYFPQANIKREDIISSYVGVRPLVLDDSGSEGKTSREHIIISDERMIHFVAGGKYTTYRLMAEEIVDRVLKFLPFEERVKFATCQTSSPLNEWTSPEAFSEAIERAKSDTEKQLAVRYGEEAFEIMKQHNRYPSYWQLEAYQAITNTMCLNLTDFYSRRVPLILAYKDHGMSVLDEVAAVFKRELGLSDHDIELQKNNLRAFINKELDWQK